MLIPFTIYLLVCSKLDWGTNWIDWVIFSFLLLGSVSKKLLVISRIAEENERLQQMHKMMTQASSQPPPQPPKSPVQDMLSKTYRGIE